MTEREWCWDEGDAALVRVRLQPRAARDGIAGERAGALVVRVSAPAIDGRANDALCRLLAKAIGVAPSRVAIVRGASARDKVVRIDGTRTAVVAARLGGS